ncbi:MAG: superoxide dismutase family protein [Myxococcota bacterium]
MRTTWIPVWLAAALVLGCEDSAVDEPQEIADEMQEDIEEDHGLAAPAGEGMQQRATVPSALADVDVLMAALQPTRGSQARGTVRFSTSGEDVKVSAEVEGLEPGSKHGFHVHEYGDCSAEDGMSAGGHYAPEDHPHALPPTTPRHAGDMGNLEADDEGRATYEGSLADVSLVGPRNPLVGRAVIVHAGEDTGEQPSGAAGPRLACGVVGIAEGEGSGAGDE